MYTKSNRSWGFVFNLRSVPPPYPQSHNFSKSEEKPTLFEFAGRSSALPVKGPEPNQLTLLEVASDGLTAGAGPGRWPPLGLAEGAGPGLVSLHCCHNQASPSRTGLLGAGGGGGGVVVRLAFGVTTTWFSKA